MFFLQKTHWQSPLLTNTGSPGFHGPPSLAPAAASPAAEVFHVGHLDSSEERDLGEMHEDGTVRCVCVGYLYIYRDIYVYIYRYICILIDITYVSLLQQHVSSSQNCAALQTDDSCVMLWFCFLFVIFVFLFFFFFFVFSFFSCFFVLLLLLLVPKFLWDHWTWLLFPIQYFTMSWIRLRCTFTRGTKNSTCI